MSDIAIARAARLVPVLDLAREHLDIDPGDLIPYGHHAAKLSFAGLEGLGRRPEGRLILVTSTSPTPAGIGKTTTTIGLGDALNRIGRKTVIALREPSLGPCLGQKGGAHGGGRAQVAPMEDINLHFTGDIHAIGSANNLLSAMIDNHIYWGNALDLDVRRIAWRRAMDMNDRALRACVSGLGGAVNGFPREAHFDITAASEVMAILCLAESLDDLERRLGAIRIGETRDRKPVRAADLGAAGAMTALLRTALQPNLVQTLEGTPAFVHGGPFANIAHGCNSVLATRAALHLGDYVVTEAGFGADLGAEKFFDIKCRKAGLAPSCTVLVTSVGAIRMQGGAARDSLDRPDPEALSRGLPNLVRHIDNLQKFGIPVAVAINRFAGDSEGEIETLIEAARARGGEAVVCDHYQKGGAGAETLAEAVLRLTDSGVSDFHPLYEDHLPPLEKARTIARSLYGAADISASPTVQEKFRKAEAEGFGAYPVCMAKTPYSFSTDATALGAPEGHVVPIRDLRISAGAGFLVAICGDIQTMPGLPRQPAALRIGLDEAGLIHGLS